MLDKMTIRQLQELYEALVKKKTTIGNKVTTQESKERAKRELRKRLRPHIQHFRPLQYDCTRCATGRGKFHKCCPRCGGQANGIAEIEHKFGWRKSKTKFKNPQPWCRNCRAIHKKIRRGKVP